MHTTPEYLTGRLHEEGDRVVEFFMHLSLEQWGILIYPQESDWTFHHLLSHFVSSEQGRRELIENIYSGGDGAPQDFDIEFYNRRGVDRLISVSNSLLLNRFSDERFGIINIVSGMQLRDLERVGNDPYLGYVALVEIIKLTYRHLQIHLRDARRYL